MLFEQIRQKQGIAIMMEVQGRVMLLVWGKWGEICLGVVCDEVEDVHGQEVSSAPCLKVGDDT
jgi:hypothetical protein